MTTDQMRALFKASGLTYQHLTPQNLAELRKHINEQMKASGAIQNTFRAAPRFKIRFDDDGNVFEAYLTCKADYFDKREAVSFNRDGFIGFAGWASPNNLLPILQGFAAWVETMRATAEA